MADTKGAALTAKTTPTTGDKFIFVDTLDTTMGATGTTKNVTYPNLATAIGTTIGIAGKANTSHTHTVADITATGTASATTYLRGDGSWTTPAGGGGTPAFHGLRAYNSAATFTGNANGAANRFATTVDGDFTANASFDQFTCAVTGYYHVTGRAKIGLNTATKAYGAILVNGGYGLRGTGEMLGTGYTNTYAAGVVYLTAGDTLAFNTVSDGLWDMYTGITETYLHAILIAA